MAQKKLEKGSVWEKADANGDGIVSDQEMAMRERMVLLKTETRKKINNAICVVFGIDGNGFYRCVNDTTCSYR